MIARLDNLRKHPAVFGHLTGVTVAAFDELAADVVPAVEAAHRKTLDRPDRQRAIGGGDDFDLDGRPGPADRRLAPPVPDPRGARVPLRRVRLDRQPRPRPVPAGPGAGRQGHDAAARPRAAAAKRLPAAAEGHARAGGGHRLVRAADAAAQAAAAGVLLGQEEGPHAQEPGGGGRGSGRVVDVSDSVPGPWADLKLLKRSRLWGGCPRAGGGMGDLAYVGIDGLHPVGGCPRASRAGSRRPRTGGTTGRSAGGGSWWSTRSAGCGGSGRGAVNRHRRRGTRRGSGRSPGWSTGCSTTEERHPAGDLDRHPPRRPAHRLADLLQAPSSTRPLPSGPG